MPVLEPAPSADPVAAAPTTTAASADPASNGAVSEVPVEAAVASDDAFEGPVAFVPAGVEPQETEPQEKITP